MRNPTLAKFSVNRQVREIGFAEIFRDVARSRRFSTIRRGGNISGRLVGGPHFEFVQPEIGSRVRIVIPAFGTKA